MKFSTVLCSLLYCSSTIALTIERRDETAGPIAVLESREAAPAIEVGVNQDRKSSSTTTKTPKTKTTSSKTKATPTTTSTKTKTTAFPKTTAAPATTSNVVKEPAPKTTSTKSKTTKQKATATQTQSTSAASPTAITIPGCSAQMKAEIGSSCGTYGTVANPQGAMTLSEIGFDSCSNACVCGNTMASCKSFAWLDAGNGSGTCTLYTRTLENMGYGGGAEVLYDRSCYKKATTPTQTMGALEMKIRKRRSAIDDHVMDALAAH